MTTNEEDFVNKLLTARSHDYILFFSNKGRVYRIKGYEIPEFSRQSKGLPVVNILSLDKDEVIKSVLVVKYDEEPNKYLVFATKNGLVKRTSLEEFENIRTNGKIAIVLKENDELINVQKSDGTCEIILGSSDGRAVRFNEEEVRVMGRNTSGVKGIDVTNSCVIGCEVINDSENQLLLIVTEKGYGKKTNVAEYRLTHRGSKGVKALNVTEKNGNLISLSSVQGDEDAMMITDAGMIIRISLGQVSTLKRNTQGIRLINLKDNHSVATVAIVEKEENSSDNTEEASDDKNNDNVSEENE